MNFAYITQRPDEFTLKPTKMLKIKYDNDQIAILE